MNEDGTASLNGAVFEIRNFSGTVLDSGTTYGTYGYVYWEGCHSVWFDTTNYLGQYLYVYEVTPPTGYEITLTGPIVIRPGYNPSSTSGTGYSIARDEDMDYLITVNDEEIREVPIRIHKTTASGYADWISGNSCYSLAGTQFAVYDNPTYAANNTVSRRVTFDVLDNSGNVTASDQTILTVASNGYTPYISLEPDKQYWVREITAGTGYVLPSNPVTLINVGDSDWQEFTIRNTPGSDPTALVLYKTNQTGSNAKPLTGAIFSVEYFAGYYSEESAARASSGTHRTWYITTKAGTGSDAGKYVAKLDTGHLVTSGTYTTTDDFFTDGSNVVFPYGTVIIKEVQAADGYWNDANFGRWDSGSQSYTQTGRDVLIVQERPDGAYIVYGENSEEYLSGEAGVGNTSLITDTMLPTVSTMLTGSAGTKEPVAYHSVTLTDTVTISDLDDFQNQNIRVEGHIYLVGLNGTTVTEIGNGTTSRTRTIRVDELTETTDLSYTFDAWKLHGRSIVAYVRVYDSDNNLICSHTDIDDADQRITFPEIGNASFYKHGEQFTGVTNNADGTITFQYEDLGLSGVVFRVIAAENITKADGTTVYTAGSVIPGYERVSPDADGILLLDDLYYGEYTLVEIETDGKHTLAGNTAFEVNALTGDTQAVDHDIPNARKTVTISLTKVQDGNTTIPVAGAKYGLYAKQSITNYTGDRMLDRDALIAYAVTGADGSATFAVDLPVGFTWYVKELFVPKGYTLDETEYTVSFADTDSDTAHLDRIVDGGDGDGKVTDKQQPGTITILKTDTDGHRLSGATFKLEYAESETGPPMRALTAASSRERPAAYMPMASLRPAATVQRYSPGFWRTVRSITA